MTNKKGFMTKFSEQFPDAYNLTLSSNGFHWGISFNRYRKKGKYFHPIIQPGVKENVLCEETFFDGKLFNSFLRNEDKKICLN